MFGILLYKYTAYFTAIGHSEKSVTSGQWMAAWMSIVRAQDMIVWIARSAIPLWWWAPTQAKLVCCWKVHKFSVY
jgi:hypothetical protein